MTQTIVLCIIVIEKAVTTVMRHPEYVSLTDNLKEEFTTPIKLDGNLQRTRWFHELISSLYLILHLDIISLPK